jgi:tetratricopeptide (TPR) repeat protein
MKAEHRHELKTNALADTLNRALHGLKAGPSRHSLLIGVVAVVVIVVGVTGYFIWAGQREGRSALWEKFDGVEGTLDTASSPDELQSALGKFKELADQNPRTLPGAAAKFDRARVLLYRGLERLYSPERDAALADLREARQLYGELADDAFIRDAHPLLGEEAMMGAAKANEALGDLDKALDGYKNVVKTYPKGAFHEQADKRAAYLADADNRARVKALYDKLDEQAKSSSFSPPTGTPDKK